MSASCRLKHLTKVPALMFPERRHRRFRSLAVFVLLSTTLWSQSPAPIGLSAAEAADTLKIAFLHQVQRYSAADADAKAQFARRVGIIDSELATLFAAAHDFASAEESLMTQARAYRERQVSSNKPLDLATVKDFTARRYTLARQAIGSLQKRLSPTSYSSLQRFLTTEFPKSVAFWR